MVLHRPVELAALTGQVDFQFSDPATSSLSFFRETTQEPFWPNPPFPRGRKTLAIYLPKGAHAPHQKEMFVGTSWYPRNPGSSDRSDATLAVSGSEMLSSSAASVLFRYSTWACAVFPPPDGTLQKVQISPFRS